MPELFDPATGVFSPLSIAGAVARASHTATLLLDGRVLMIGGTRGDSMAVDTEIWDLKVQTASRLGIQNLDRVGHTATLLGDGRVIVASGTTLDGQPASDRLVSESHRSKGRHRAVAATLQRGAAPFESQVLDAPGIQSNWCSQFHRGALAGDAGSR